MKERYQALEQNICDFIKEEQIKIGYRKETIRLYYPLASLNNFLHTSHDEVRMRRELADFAAFAAERLGKIEVSCHNERFCFVLPPEAAEYVHTHTKEGGFLYDFIRAMEKHGITIGEIKDIFLRYAEHVHFERLRDDDFDYLICFEDGEPDDYRYCITEEGEHLTYHRFTKEDYDAL